MKSMHELFDGSEAQELGSATAENALPGAEDSNPQRVEAPQTAHRHDCESNVYFDCPGCAAAYARQQMRQVLLECVNTCFHERAHAEFMSDPNHFVRKAVGLA